MKIIEKIKERTNIRIKAAVIPDLCEINKSIRNLREWQESAEEAIKDLEARIYDLETAATVDEGKINHMGERLDNFWEELNEHYHNMSELQDQMEEYDTRADDQESEISEIQEKLGMLDDRTPPWDNDEIAELEEEVQNIKKVFRFIGMEIKSAF